MKNARGAGLACGLALAIISMHCASRRPAPHADRLEDAQALVAKAEGLSANAQFDGANFFLGRAADMFDSAQRWAEAVQCLVHMGNNFQKTGELDQAKSAFLKALRLVMDHGAGGDLELAKSILQLAFKMMVRKEYPAALEMMNRSLAIQQKVFGADSPELGKVYNSLALLYLHMGDAQKSNEFANKSLSAKIRRYLDTDSSFLKYYSFLDGVSISERSFEDMSGMLDKSLVVYLESLGSGHPLVASIYEKLGMVCALQGLYEQGLDFFRKALRIWLDAVGEEDVRVAVVYEEMGICLRLQGELPEARRYLRQALEIAQAFRQPSTLASIHFQMGKVCFLQNLCSEALEQYRLSLTALALAPARLPVGLEAPRGVETINDRQNLLEILDAQAEAFEARAALKPAERGDLLDAYRSIQEAVRLVDLLRADYKAEKYRLLFGEKSQRILDLAVRVSLRLFEATGAAAYKESAFVYSEKSKAAVLAENMLEADARQVAGIPAQKLARERELKSELTRLETLLQRQAGFPAAAAQPADDARGRYYSLLAEYQELISSFERDYPQYFELKYGGGDVSVASVQKSLPAGTVLVEYFLGTSYLDIFFLARERFEVVRQPLETRFTDDVTAYCQAIRKIDEKAFLRLGPRLYRVLVAPIEEWLRGKDKLIIIPDGVLAYLPFETLVARERRVSDFSRLDFLLRRFAVSYHFSARLWQGRLRSETPPRNGAWAGFAPVFSNDGRKGYILRSEGGTGNGRAGAGVARTVTVGDREFPELPGTEDELRAIIGLFMASHREAQGFFRSEATEERFKSPAMKGFAMIHLATHTLTNEADSKLSGFLFYPPGKGTGGEDGVLYAGETYDLNLDCDLLVLSSCESGTGRLVEGEGLLALTRGLFYSGARGIIFTLWKVEDRTTGELMAELYQDILQGQPYAQALRKAKLSFIANPFTAFPKYWAGFILLGM
jgi:CHAT domain-containing protein/tetratricopeptide (TPR) repeat protein